MEIDVKHPIKTFTSLDTPTAALLIQFLTSVAYNLMASFMPLFITSEFNQSLIEATGWTGAISFLSSTLMATTAPFWGWMCDRFDAKKILQLVFVGNIIIYTGMTFSTNVLQIFFFRALHGGLGAISTIMFAIIASTVPIHDLKKALSYQMTAMTMGVLVAPGIGGLLAALIGYRITMLASGLIFVALFPIVFILNLSPASGKDIDTRSFKLSDFKALIPDIISLILVYICISFIAPIIPWYLEHLGVLKDQLLLWTTAATILNGLAFAVATPLLSSATTDRTMPLLSVGASIAIMLTAFVFNPIQFIILRILIGAVQAGIPPNLFGGKSGRKGMGMGFLNSARFLGMAFGPIMATTILGDGLPPKPFNMYLSMAIISVITAVFLYLPHANAKKSLEEAK